MVNTGKPSTGCHTCRKRKVKCDQVIPYCGNCARIAKPCPGYRIPIDGLFKTNVAAIRTDTHHQPGRSISAEWVPFAAPHTPTNSEPLGPRGQGYVESGASEPGLGFFKEEQASRALAEGQEDSQDVPYLPSPIESLYSDLKPVLTLSTDVAEHAVCYSLVQLDTRFRDQYQIDTYAFLPKLIHNAGPTSAVHQAMRACATVNLANRAGTVSLSQLTASEYARAIISVNKSLESSTERLKDETLIAVWLLGMRELVIEVAGRSAALASTRMAMSSRLVHQDGTITLLRLRGEAQLETPQGRHISVTILSAMHWRCLFGSQEPTKEYLDLEALLTKASPILPGPLAKLRAFFHGVTKIRHRIKNLIATCQHRDYDLYTARTAVKDYLKAAKKLEDKMNGWCDDPGWQPQAVNAEAASSSTMHSIYALFTFYYWDAFFLWNRYLVAKITLHAGLLDALRLLPDQQLCFESSGYSTIAELRQQNESALRVTVDRYLGIMAYAFGYVNPPMKNDDSDHVHRRGQKKRDMNVAGSLQVFQPLAFFTNLEYMTYVQREAVVKALQLMIVAYRTR